mgnify:FL=1
MLFRSQACTGAGLVQVAAPAPVQPLVAQAQPCFMTAPLPARSDGQISAAAIKPILKLAEWADVIAMGPGLGSGRDIVLVVLGLLQHLHKPLVLDADGLNALAKILAVERRLPRADVMAAAAPLICTPHLGEFTRLIGRVCRGEELVTEANRFAREQQAVLVVKGHRTLITDGEHIVRNETGNPGMATGGSGDVLTGVIAALVGQKLDALSAAILGVHLHGLAGDLAAQAIGPVGLIASDLADFLPRALSQSPADATR